MVNLKLINLVLGLHRIMCQRNMRGGWSVLGMGKVRFHNFLIQSWSNLINNLIPYYKSKSMFCFLQVSTKCNNGWGTLWKGLLFHRKLCWFTLQQLLDQSSNLSNTVGLMVNKQPTYNILISMDSGVCSDDDILNLLNTLFSVDWWPIAYNLVRKHLLLIEHLTCKYSKINLNVKEKLDHSNIIQTG